MKCRNPLFALACLAFAVAPAFADGGSPSSVLFQGLHYSPQGACLVDVDADGQLEMSNIGSSGQDGVSVDCLHTSGMRLSLCCDCDDTDNGARATMTYHWSFASRPALSVATSMEWSVASDHALCTPDCSSLSSAASQTVTLTRDGVVVCRYVLTSGVPLRVAMDASGRCPNPTLSCSVSRSPAEGTVRWHGCAAFSRSVTVTVAAVDYDCDGLDFSCPVDTQDEDCDGVSCDLSVASPPGSHFSSVHCPNGECRVFDQFVHATSSAELSVLPSDGALGKKLYVGNLPFVDQGGMELVHVGEVCDDGNSDVGDGCSRATADVSCPFAPLTLAWTAPGDDGGSMTFSATGKLFSLTGAPGAVGEAHAKVSKSGDTMTGPLLLSADHSGLGADAESVIVIDQGVVVERITILPNATVQVGGSPEHPATPPIVAFGRSHELSGHVTLIKSPVLAANGGAHVALSSSASPIDVPMQISFASPCLFFETGKIPVECDEIVFTGASSTPGTYDGSFVVQTSGLSVSRPSSSSSLSSLSILDFARVGQDEVFADPAPSTALSTAHTCVTVPVDFARTDATPVRAFSVRFHLSPELAQCGASVVEGDYLSRIAGTQMYVTDNGGGSYTVDCGILGPVCGATGNGRLFTVDLGAVMPPASNVGVVTVDDVRVRDCSNAPVPAGPGSAALIPIQFASPPALSGLAAVQVRSGNPPGGTTEISVTFPALTTAGSSLELYRKGFGNYPEYDNGSAPGSVPSPPASSSAALASGWTLVTCGSSCGSGSCTSTCTASSMLDSPQGRDYLYYVAFVRDAYGNESPVSNMTTGTLDYHLGDVSDGSSLCVGDNHVSLPDLSFLGAQYGRVLTGGPFTCLDVGPTLDYSVLTRPTTDGVADFEDFMMFAINWSVVSAPSAAARPVAAAINASSLAVPSLPPAGQTFDAAVVVDGAGDVQGMSVKLAFDPDVLEQVGVAPGALLDQQGRLANVLSSGPGDVDAALFGGGPGIAGHGELARVTFRVKAAGDPHLAIASITARDAANHPIAVAGASGGAVVPARTALGFAYPNPFRESVAIQLSLHRTGVAAIGIYDVAGRRVRTLVRGEQPAGARLVTWDGRDDSGLRLAPGAYIVRLETEGVRESRTLRLIR